MGIDLVILLGGTQNTTSSSLIGETMTVSNIEPWQNAVRNILLHFVKAQDSRGVGYPPDGIEWIESELNQLSSQPYPTSEDIKLVQDIAYNFTVDSQIRRNILEHPNYRNAMRWQVNNNRISLHRPGPSPIWLVETILHFEVKIGQSVYHYRKLSLWFLVIARHTKRMKYVYMM